MIPAIEHLTAEQIVSYIGVFIGTALGAALWYRTNYKRPPIDNCRVAEDLVLTSGVIADMTPVRDVVASLKDIARHLEDGVEESRKTRRVWEKIHQRLETNAEIELRVASEVRRHGGPR